LAQWLKRIAWLLSVLRVQVSWRAGSPLVLLLGRGIVCCPDP
jgi:hypothetical protein